MNIAKMMKQAKQMQTKVSEMQAKLAEQRFSSSVGGGKVEVLTDGTCEVLSIKIDPAVADGGDIEKLEELVLSGVKEAIQQAKACSKEEMNKLTSELGLPSGFVS